MHTLDPTNGYKVGGRMVAAERAVAEIAIMAFVIASFRVGWCGTEIVCDRSFLSDVLRNCTDILTLNKI